MSELPCNELHLLLDRAGALIAYQENDTAWAGVLGFSSAELARSFVDASKLDAAEIAAIDPADAAAVTVLIAQVKKRAIRYLLLDLDYRTGVCQQVDFEDDRFGKSAGRQLTPRRHR